MFQMKKIFDKTGHSALPVLYELQTASEEKGLNQHDCYLFRKRNL
jgi:hypothetical protein